MDDEKTVINVKAVPVAAWHRAKSASTKQGESLGAWLGRAINQLADVEAGPREFPPDRANLRPEPVKPISTLSAADLSSMLQAVAALSAATGVSPTKTDVRRAYALVDDLVRDSRGQSRKPSIAGKASGQSLLENGKAGQSRPPHQTR